MPYITQARRDALDKQLTELSSHIWGPGELNYVITRLLHRYVNYASPSSGLRYQTMNEVVGVLECAKAEFYRRIVVPYEDAKIAENGDIDAQQE